MEVTQDVDCNVKAASERIRDLDGKMEVVAHDVAVIAKSSAYLTTSIKSGAHSSLIYRKRADQSSGCVLNRNR